MELREFLNALAKMDQRTLAVQALGRCVVRMWVPVLVILALTIALFVSLESWLARAVWSAVGCAGGYVLCGIGEKLCVVGQRLIQHNLDECAPMLPKETKDDVA